MKIGNHNYFLSWREPWHKLRTGTGSTDVISAGTAAWTLCPLTLPASSRCSRRLWRETMSRQSTPLGAPQPLPPRQQQQQFVQPPPQFAPQTQFAGQQQRPAPPAGLPPRPVRPIRPQSPPPRPQPSRNPFTSIFSNFRLPFF